MLKLFSYWHQGFANAPAPVQICVQSWNSSLHGVELIALDARSCTQWVAEPELSPVTLNRLGLAHRSDMLRTQLLIKHGGVWADATVYMNTPIMDWVPDLLEPSGLFLFHRPGRDREISNWFIAAQPNHPILVAVYERLLDFWSAVEFRNFGRPYSPLEQNIFRLINRNRWAPRLWTWTWFNRMTRIFPYMIYHYIFHDVVFRDRELKRLWKLTPKISADGPHALARLGLTSPVTSEARRLIEHPVAPVYKLKWRIKDDNVPEGSVLDTLRSAIRS